MEKKAKKIIYANNYYKGVTEAYLYGVNSFGHYLADFFTQRLQGIVDELEYNYNLHPECKHLPTKSKIYRNIIFGKYLVIYRITTERVEILTMLHSTRSVAKIKTARKIKL